MSGLPNEQGPAVGEAVATVAEPSRLKRGAVWIWRFVVGAVFVQSLVGAFIAYGWTVRTMRRWTLKRWWAKSACRDRDEHFRAFAARYEPEATSLPRWILGAPITATKGNRRIRDYIARALGGLGSNIKSAALIYLPTVAFVMPAQVLWWFGWYAGWDNSFNKGYEQATVGVSIAVLGMVIFSLVMLYMPMAQARAAVTGDWRSFFDFGLTRRLIRTSWPKMLGLSVAYAAAAIPVMAFTVFVVVGLPNAVEGFSDFTNEEALVFMNAYYFRAGAVVLLCFLLVHRMGARVYADAVIRGLADRTIAPEELSPYERETLEVLGHVPSESPEERGKIVKLVTAAAKPIYRIPCIIACFVVWFMVAFGVNVSSFFNYRGANGWLNHPLIELPMIRYIPGHLKGEEPGYKFTK